MKKIIQTAKSKMYKAAISAHGILADESGQSALDIGITILVSVVLGALLLTGLYALFGDVIMPSITSKIKEMFNYAG